MTKTEQEIDQTPEQNHVDMADVCELAHTLTVRECKIKCIPLGGRSSYTAQAQKVFDYFYQIITNTLNV